MAICRTLIACRIPKATDIHSKYVILIAFPLERWLRERASIICYRYIFCLVHNGFLDYDISLSGRCISTFGRTYCFSLDGRRNFLFNCQTKQSHIPEHKTVIHLQEYANTSNVLFTTLKLLCSK